MNLATSRTVLTSIALSTLVAIPVALADSPPVPPTPPAAAAPAGLTVPMGRWMVVVETSGKGLKKGGGVLLRADGFDTAEAKKGSTNPTTCTAKGDEVTCENGLSAKALPAGKVKVSMGPLTLTLGPATDAQGKEFSTWVEASVAQQKACNEAANCCMAAETVLGKTCDLNAVLGDRKLATCKAALEKVRAEVTAKKAALPEACGK